MREVIEKIQSSLLHRIDSCVQYPLFTLRHAPEMSSVIYEVNMSLSKGIPPIRIDDDENEPHVFLLHDLEKKPLAVFRTVRYINEYAAYRLDHDHFANVLPTTLTTLEHAMWGGNRWGSLQLFEEGCKDVKDVGVQEINFLPANFVRRIASLDLRLLNHGRHRNNILYKEGELIPIDHEYVLQKDIALSHFCWLSWKQARTSFSSEERDYFSLLDPWEDRMILKEELGFSEEIANHCFVSTSFLKAAIVRGLTLYELGLFFRREKNQDFSQFEKLRQKVNPYLDFRFPFLDSRVRNEIERAIDVQHG